MLCLLLLHQSYPISLLFQLLLLQSQIACKLLFLLLQGEIHQGTSANRGTLAQGRIQSLRTGGPQQCQTTSKGCVKGNQQAALPTRKLWSAKQRSTLPSAGPASLGQKNCCLTLPLSQKCNSRLISLYPISKIALAHKSDCGVFCFAHRTPGPCPRCYQPPAELLDHKTLISCWDKEKKQPDNSSSSDRHQDAQ